MADWNDIADSELIAGQPLNTSLFSRLARNPQAMFEGAPGAPTISPEAFGALSPGDVVFHEGGGGGFRLPQRGVVRWTFTTNNPSYYNNADPPRLYTVPFTLEILVDGVVQHSLYTNPIRTVSFDLAIGHFSIVSTRSTNQHYASPNNSFLSHDGLTPAFPPL